MIVGLVRHRVTLFTIVAFSAVVLASVSSSRAWAEGNEPASGPPSVTVQKDKNDNIHVLVDPSMLTKLQANRQNGKITMIVPKDQADAIHVDRVLKDAKVVEVTNTLKGRQIQINTDAVYWDVKPVELPKQSVKTVNKLAPLNGMSKSAHKTNQKTKLASNASRRNWQKSLPELSAIGGVRAQRLAVKNARQKIAAQKSAKQTEDKTIALSAKQGAKPELKKNIVVQPSAKSFARAAQKIKPIPEPKVKLTLHVPDDRATQPEPRDIIFPAVAESHQVKYTSAKVASSKTVEKKVPIPEPVSGLEEPIVNDTSAKAMADEPRGISGDEESALLNWEESKTASVPGGFGFPDLFRIAGSLLVVLVLLVGFMKWILPRMVANGYFLKKEESVQFGRRIPKKGKNGHLDDEPTAPRTAGDLSGLSVLRRASANPMPKPQPVVPSHTQVTTSKAYATPPAPQGSWQPPSQRYADPNRTWEKYPPLRKNQDAPQAQPPRPQTFLAGYDQPGRYTAAQEYPYATPPTLEHPAQPVRSEPMRQPQPQNSSNPEYHRHALMKESPQRAFIERLGEEEEGFHILNSAKIDKSKELHLIEIRGRQLVLATTPYSVSLVTELSGNNLISREHAAAFLAETAKKVQDSQDIYKKYLSSETSQKRHQVYNDYTREDRFTDPADVVVLDDYDDVFRR